MFFNYKGINKNKGTEIKGEIEANSLEEASRKLISQNIIFEKIEETRNTNKKKSNKKWFVNENKLIYIFITELNQFMQLNVDLKIALKLLSQKEKNNLLKSIYENILYKLESGSSFNSALQEQNLITFPIFITESIKIAEEGNNLKFVFKKLSEYLENISETKDGVLQALLYPVLIFITALLVVSYMLTSIVPKVVQLFQNNHQELPDITIFVISVSNYLQEDGIYILTSIIIISLTIIYFYKKSHFVRYKIDNLFLKIPIYGKLLQNKELSRFLSLLHILLKNNMSTDKALSVAKNIIDNVVLKKEFTEKIALLSTGDSLSNIFSDSKNINEDFLNLMFLSDKNNNLADISKTNSELLSKKNKKVLKTLMTLIEPISMLIVGIFIAIILIAILLPIFTMGN